MEIGVPIKKITVIPAKEPIMAPEPAQPPIPTLWGDVVIHRHGYRAQYARVVGMHGGNLFFSKRLRRHYGVNSFYLPTPPFMWLSCWGVYAVWDVVRITIALLN